MKVITLAVLASAIALPAFAQGVERRGPIYVVPDASMSRQYGDDLTTGSIGGAPRAERFSNVPGPGQSSADAISTDPAADGNANMLTRPTPNYGGVSGGYISR